MSKKGSDLARIVAEHINELVAIITTAMRRELADEITAFLASQPPAPRRRAIVLRPKRILPCIAPGCHNPSKGPRFRYLCDEHKGAKKADVAAWRQARKDGGRKGSAAAPAAAADRPRTRAAAKRKAAARGAARPPKKADAPGVAPAGGAGAQG